MKLAKCRIATQAKLLRVLEDRKLRRLGSKVETTVDVRVLAATNKVPEEAVAQGELRNDLYYRLNVFNIHMPRCASTRKMFRIWSQSLLVGYERKNMDARSRPSAKPCSIRFAIIPGRAMCASCAIRWSGQ